jgi:septum site-determining protein MinC
MHRASPFRFHGRSFFALVLGPKLPLSAWLNELDRLLTSSPGFFARKPVVIDVAGLKLTKIKLLDLVGELGRKNIRILGIEGADPSWSDDDLPPLLTAERAGCHRETLEQEVSASQVSAETLSVEPSLLIEEPLRSGQSILHGGDVIVVGSVASGAEIIASGSVHVYGPLRGRVFAGASGNPEARIFCSKLEAELIAINGYYRVSDELEKELQGRPVRASLEGKELRIAALD